uniref:(northern house mosquito) hypothetical protein n=1 Tax=Culex pipiens TaxID=7175 RepID=A0A8D8F346_CULPI
MEATKTKQHGSFDLFPQSGEAEPTTARDAATRVAAAVEVTAQVGSEATAASEVTRASVAVTRAVSVRTVDSVPGARLGATTTATLAVAATASEATVVVAAVASPAMTFSAAPSRICSVCICGECHLAATIRTFRTFSCR